MFKLLPLVCYYLLHNRGKTAVLTLCFAIAIYLPISAHWLVAMLQDSMLRRAESTPLIIGPQGSRFDLVLHTLYFQTEPIGTLPMEETTAIRNSGYATPVPVYIAHRARGYPIVGTSIDYYPSRQLTIAEGHLPTRLGDCVVGWQTAQALNLSAGDRLPSDPEDVFNLGGNYPLNMRVTGILGRSDSADDRAVFVDLKTAWILDGIGHGHDDVSTTDNPIAILNQMDRHTVASAAVKTHTTITAENVGSFHFHGDPERFPISAVIAYPKDQRAETLLLGRYADTNSRYQALRPLEVTQEMLTLVIRLKRFFDVQYLFLLGVVALFVSLVVLLSVRLRKNEANTLFHIGCSRRTFAILQITELTLIATASTMIALIASSLTMAMAQTWIRTLTG